jgi:hypothetical protein
MICFEKKKMRKLIQFLYVHRPVTLSLKTTRPFPMMLPFADWSAHKIIGPLNQREVHAVLLEYNIKRSSFHTWDIIKRMILHSGDDVKMVLYESGKGKAVIEEQHQAADVKRHQEAKAMAWNVWWHIGQFFSFLFFKIRSEYWETEML